MLTPLLIVVTADYDSKVHKVTDLQIEEKHFIQNYTKSPGLRGVVDKNLFYPTANERSYMSVCTCVYSFCSS